MIGDKTLILFQVSHENGDWLSENLSWELEY